MVYFVTRGMSTASVLFNNGNSTFAAKIDYPASLRPYSVAAADIDGDGDIDFATAQKISNTVSVFRNNGNGTFAPAASYPTSNSSISLLAVNLDENGRRDLVVKNSTSNDLSVLSSRCMP